MVANLRSSAPHIHDVSVWSKDLVDWRGHQEPIDGHSTIRGRLLWKGGEDGLPEAGIRECTPGSWRLALPRDELCHFTSGRAVCRADDGEVIEVVPGTIIHFPEGWTGEVDVFETLRSIYMLR